MELVEESMLKALGFACVVLLIGVLVGMQADDARTSFIEDQIEESNIQAQTFIVTENYLSDSSQNYCRVVSGQIPEIAEGNAQIGRDLQSMSGKSITGGEDYEQLKRKYYVNQLRLYNMLEGYRDRCDADTTSVFYFFDSSVQSQRQGAVLTEYRDQVDNQTYVFSFNLETDDSAVLDILREDYNITDAPTLVVNGNQTYRGYVPLAELREVL